MSSQDCYLSYEILGYLKSLPVSSLQLLNGDEYIWANVPINAVKTITAPIDIPALTVVSFSWLKQLFALVLFASQVGRFVSELDFVE